MPRWHSAATPVAEDRPWSGTPTELPATCSSNKAVDLIHRPETQHLQPREKRLVDGSVSNVDVVPVPGKPAQALGVVGY
nr:unnamed protein product [Callosobruchus analis]